MDTLLERLWWLGWFNVGLFSFNFSLFIFREIYRKTRTTNASFRFILKYLRKIHKYTGITLLVTGLLHGYIELGTIAINTGFLIWLAVFFMFLLYLSRKRLKLLWLRLHKGLAFLIIFLIIIHRLYPYFYIIK